MAYLHCHKCGWSQDDFWHKGYNPIFCIIDNFKSYLKPRVIIFDSWYAKEQGWKSSKKHSWAILLLDTKIDIRKILRQKWWTYKKFMSDKKKGIAKCPKCKSSKDFDID